MCFKMTVNHFSHYFVNSVRIKLFLQTEDVHKAKHKISNIDCYILSKESHLKNFELFLENIINRLPGRVAVKFFEIAAKATAGPPENSL